MSLRLRPVHAGMSSCFTLQHLESRTLLSSVAIDLSSTAQMIDAFGGNYARGQFKTADGTYVWQDAVGEYTLEHLTPGILRVPIILEDWEALNDNADPNVINSAGFVETARVRGVFEMMQDFEARGIRIVASVWDAPNWMVSNPTEPDQRIVPEENWDELTESIGAWLGRAKAAYGVNVDYVSFNEADGGFDLMFTAAENAGFIKLASPIFADMGLDVKWVAGETYRVQGATNYIRAILDDPEAEQYIGPISFHSWWSESIPASDWAAIKALGAEYNRPIWVGELGTLNGVHDEEALLGSSAFARRIAKTYHKSIAWAGASALLHWQYQADYQIMSDDASVKYYAYHVIEQLKKNLPQGSQIVSATSDDALVYALAGKHVDRNTFMTQLINDSTTTAKTVTITGLPNTPLTLVRTASGEKGVTVGTYTPVGGQLTLTLSAGSVNVLSGALSASAATVVTAREDAYVRGGTFDDDNFGADPELHAKEGTGSSYDRRAYVKFDIGPVSTIEKATLRLYGSLIGSTDPSLTVSVYGAGSAWAESSVTWTTKPALSASAIGTITVTGTSPTWYELDVTDYVNAQKATGATAVTLALVSLAESSVVARFSSSESASNQPELRLDPPRPIDANVSINVNDAQQTITALGGNYAQAYFREYAQDGDGRTNLAELDPRLVRVGIPSKGWEALGNDDADPNTHNYAGFNEQSYIRDLFNLIKQFNNEGRTVVASLFNLPDWLVSNPTWERQRLIKPGHFEETAEHVVAFVKRAWDGYGARIHYLSFNESNGGFRVRLTAQEQADLIAMIGTKLQEAGLPTKFLIGDTYQIIRSTDYLKRILDDPQAAPFTGPLSFHSWWSMDIARNEWQAWRELADAYGKELWNAEMHWDAQLEDWQLPTWSNNGIQIADIYAKTLAWGNANAAIYWQYQHDYQLISSTGTKYPAWYAVKSYVDHLKPGSQVVWSQVDDNDIRVVAGRDIARDHFMTNLINNAPEEKQVRITGLPDETLTLMRTGNDGARGKIIGSFTPINGELVLTLPGTSLSTLYGELGAIGADPAPELPSGWRSVDIGHVGTAGNTTASSGTSFIVSGAGPSIGSGNNDRFHFAYKWLDGDGQIVARVADFDGADPNAKVGVMMRSGISGYDRMAALVLTPSNGVQMITRDLEGASGKANTVVSTTSAQPQWLKIVRKGHFVTFHTSVDGSSWTQVGSATVNFGQKFVVGLAVSSNSTSSTDTGRFTNVAVASLPSSETEVVLDDTSATKSGTWSSSTSRSGYIGSSYLHDGNTGKGSKTVTWTPNLPESGSYEVYVRYTSDTNRATNVPYDVHHNGGVSSVMLDQKTGGGEWVRLGTYAFNAGTGGKVVLRTTGTNGYVVADAVRFVRAATSSSPAEKVFDNPDATYRHGTWTSSTGGQGGFLGSDYLHDGNAAKGLKRIVWETELTGTYRVYARWVSHSNRASNTPYDVRHADGVSTILQDQRIGGGTWNLLGTFDFDGLAQVVLRTDGTDGYVIADGLRFVRV